MEGARPVEINFNFSRRPTGEATGSRCGCNSYRSTASTCQQIAFSTTFEI